MQSGSDPAWYVVPRWRTFALLGLVVLIILFSPRLAPPTITEESICFDRIGTVTAYHRAAPASRMILLVSGEHGWNQEMIAVARALTVFDAMVVGIDLPHYLTKLGRAEEACAYPGGDFDALSKFVQQKTGFPTYNQPVLVGVGAGAAFVYAIAAQAPPDMFQGVISLGFCPELVTSKPLCAWNSLQWHPQPAGDRFTLVPGGALTTVWIALHGDHDASCTAQTVEAFAAAVPHSTFLYTPQGDHDLSSPSAWPPQFRRAFARLFAAPAPAPPAGPLADLPLVEMLARSTTIHTLAVILSGDGGWASIDRQLADTLISQGVSVVGLNSLRYFWTRRTPEEAARDLERILQHYLAVWRKTDVLLIGYSQGADVLPFLANRLSPDDLNRVRSIVLLGPAPTAVFEFHFTDWLGEVASTGRPVLPEIKQLQGKRLVCVYGEEETNTLCTRIDPTLADVIRLGGGHHFDGSYEALANTILHEVGVSTQTQHPQ